MQFVLNCNRSTVKHALQHTQNDCYQRHPNSSRVHPIRFRPGLCPGPRSGSLQRSPRPIAGLRGPTSKGRGEKGTGNEGRGIRGRGRGRTGNGGNGREGVGMPEKGVRRGGEGRKKKRRGRRGRRGREEK